MNMPLMDIYHLVTKGDFAYFDDIMGFIDVDAFIEAYNNGLFEFKLERSTVPGKENEIRVKVYAVEKD